MAKEIRRGRKPLARNDEEIAQRIADSTDKEFARLAVDLPKYYDVLKAAALGEKETNEKGKLVNKWTPTNQLSAAKVLIEEANKFLKAYNEKQDNEEKLEREGKPSATPDPVEEEEKPKASVSLMKFN